MRVFLRIIGGDGIVRWCCSGGIAPWPMRVFLGIIGGVGIVQLWQCSVLNELKCKQFYHGRCGTLPVMQNKGLDGARIENRSLLVKHEVESNNQSNNAEFPLPETQLQLMSSSPLISTPSLSNRPDFLQRACNRRTNSHTQDRTNNTVTLVFHCPAVSS